MGTLDSNFNTWDSEIDLGGEPAAFQGEFIVNCDANGFNAKVKLSKINLGAGDDIIHYVNEAVIEVIEEEILEALVTEDDAYYKKYPENDQPYDEEDKL